MKDFTDTDTDDLKDFADVTGLTPEEAASASAEGEGMAASKIRASIRWLSEITALEALQRQQAALAEEIDTGDRIPASEARRAVQAVTDAAQKAVSSLIKHATAIVPAAHGYLDYADERINRFIFANLPECARIAAFRYAEGIADRAEYLAEGNDPDAVQAFSNALEVLAKVQAANIGDEEGIADYVLRIAALLEELPAIALGAEIGATAEWWKRVDGMTLSELEAELAAKQAELSTVES
jgi:head-tail adaptor